MVRSRTVAFDAPTLEKLQRYGFDEAAFSMLRSRLQAGDAATNNHIQGTLAPPHDDDLVVLPPLGSPEREALRAEGETFLARGEVAMVVLAGGMATRFGGVVKALVPAVGEHTFLDLKIADARAARRRSQGQVPCCFMTSFATHDAIASALSADEDLHAFPQHISVRLEEDGSAFGVDGSPSLYAPGHGDLPSALARAGLIDALRSRGVRTILMSNVDNLTATLDPAVVALHRRGSNPMSAELVDKDPGDRGGAPARVNDHCEIVEAFRFPPDFDQDRIPVFNTNTLYFELDALDQDFDLEWFVVRKTVEQRSVVQFERLVGQLSAFLDCTFLRVPRTGDDARFQPAKSPAELEERRPQIVRVLRQRGIVEE